MLTWIVVATAQATPRFPPGAIWNQDISAQSADPNSAKMIAASVGWGTGATQFQLDFSMHTLYDAGQSTTPTALVKEPGYYLPDCDTGLSVPLPAVGAIEGSSNYRCDIANNDCHLFVVDGNMLYESYQTMVDTSGLHSLCLVKWRLDLVYPQNGRGDGCTSADAAGFPMAPLIFGPDEVYAAMQGSGDLGHAIRFILPNSRMRRGAYVYPASHNGAPGSSSPDAIPYGAHLRLQAGFNISAYNPAAQVILRTLKKYGMFLSDGGSVPLTADDGMFSAHKWTDANINVDSHSLFGVALGNFEVMPLGSVIAYDNSSPAAECVRNNVGALTPPTFPVRILDTRAGFATIDGLFAGGGALGATSTRDLLVSGRGNVPASGATAVMLNLTATNTSAPGFVTAWPAGTAWPLASNLNFTAGQTVPNLALAKLGDNGNVSLFNSAGSTDLIADVEWYFDASSQVTALVPARILDTRPGFTTVDGQFAGNGALSSGQRLDLKVGGRGGLPASGVGSVVMNVTVTDPSASGFITVWPTGQSRPLASNLNFTPAQTVPNLVITGVGTNGEVSLFNSAGNTQLIADITGWFPNGAQLTSLTPARLLDTRAGAGTVDGQFSGGGAMRAQAVLDLIVSGRGGVPASAAAVVLNVTAVLPSAAGYVTVWPSGFSQPNASNLNLAPGQTRPNLVIAAIGSNGKVSLFNSTGTTDIVVDVLGWLAPGS